VQTYKIDSSGNINSFSSAFPPSASPVVRRLLCFGAFFSVLGVFFAGCGLVVLGGGVF